MGKKEKSKQETKEIQQGKEDLDTSRSESKNKSIIDTMIDKVRKLSTEDKEDKEVPVSEKITSTNENEDNEKRKSKLEKEEERRKEKLIKDEECAKKKALEREKEGEKKKQKEKEKK